MSGYPPYDGFTQTAIILAIILSAIISLISTSSRKQAVAYGQATAPILAELTGILDPKDLLETFGPPDMGRVWRTVTLFEVRKARRSIGWLISSDLVDYCCVGIAALAIFVTHALVNIGLFGALAVQVSGWIVTARLPK